MKTFKQFICEGNELSKVNDLLQKYVNGSVPDDYDNEQPSVKQLFDQLYSLFNKNGITLTIMKDGEAFDGKGIIIKDKESMHFELADDGGTKYKLHVEIKKNENGDYFFSTVRVEK